MLSISILPTSSQEARVPDLTKQHCVTYAKVRTSLLSSGWGAKIFRVGDLWGWSLRHGDGG